MRSWRRRPRPTALAVVLDIAPPGTITSATVGKKKSVERTAAPSTFRQIVYSRVSSFSVRLFRSSKSVRKFLLIPPPPPPPPPPRQFPRILNYGRKRDCHVKEVAKDPSRRLRLMRHLATIDGFKTPFIGLIYTSSAPWKRHEFRPALRNTCTPRSDSYFIMAIELLFYLYLFPEKKYNCSFVEPLFIESVFVHGKPL